MSRVIVIMSMAGIALITGAGALFLVDESKQARLSVILLFGIGFALICFAQAIRAFRSGKP